MEARKSMAAVVIAITILAFAGCGGGGKGGDHDANDLPEVDTSTDQTTDQQPDTEPDTEPDVAPDTEPDSTADVPMDTPADWPTDIPADWPVETSAECASAGGFCTEVRWEICPAGYEPIDPDPHRDCPGEGEGVIGWCCVVAPYSTCTASGAGNCVVGTTCTSCWGPVTGYTCESGRVCCRDICG